MIKVNLLRSRVTSVAQSDGVDGLSFDMADDAAEASSKNKIMLKKVFLMSLATIGLIAWENYSTDTYKTRAKELSGQANQINAQLAKLKKESGRAEEVEGEATKIEEKLKIIVDLSRKRLKELKALDFLQSVIPDGTWLSTIDYDGEKVLFTGFAQSDEDLSKFVTKLEESVFFDEVLLIKSIKSSSKEGTVKSFELSSILGEEI